ncbi:MAG TPA: hypothetical protein VMD92_02255 [Acidobacteriaceae bacterium]|nr:hypothetical protein [Acidobacteriaceae bacterium]
MQSKNIAGLVVLSLALALGAGAQNAPGSSPAGPPDASHKPQATTQPQTSSQPQTSGAPNQDQAQTHITPQQAKELFASVGTILQFASDDTKLPIRHEVKSKLITRAQVEKYLVDKLNDDKDARRMEREEIVLKKFGLIDPDFQLRPFMVKLLDEQIAAFYDSKTKTVNLLDWIDPSTQKPVLAHELTHALQDQRVNLDKWEDQTSDDLSHNYTEDLKHVATDEDDTARDAVLEGQAMAVFVDYSLQPLHRTLRNSPGMIETLVENMADDSSSPVLMRAPLLLQESLLFPYKDGLKFEATLLTDSNDPSTAFAGVLDRPPDSSYEIMNPHAYERHAKVPLLRMPDIHPIIDSQYNPYDIGVMGELDVRILAELFGGNQVAAELTPEWDGGIYYAAQKKSAPDKNSTASVALLYLSQWKSIDAAADFVKMYADELSHKYTKVTRDTADESSEDEQVYQTNEGPVLIVTSGTDVFISESFDLNVARKLQLLMLSAQQDSGAQVASYRTPSTDLSGSMVQFMAGCGIMKAALPHH